MTGVRPRYVPLGFAFPELNVRTYVKTPGRSGVWFFSLDATSRIAVRVARYFGLPYYDAAMTVNLRGDAVYYRSVRLDDKAETVAFEASYSPTAAAYYSVPGTLDHWLTERQCLYSVRKSVQVVYGDIHHAPWSLQPAEADVRTITLTRPIGIELRDSKPVSHFARYQEVVAWPIETFEQSD